MGSGNNRKNNDQPIIKRPKTEVVGDKKDAPEQVAELCPVSFQKELDDQKFVVEGAPLDLILNENQYSIYVAGNKIGQLTNKQSNTVAKCNELGIKYKGQIIKNNRLHYARFFRIT